MKKLLSTVCVVVTAVVMLTPTKTEAQNPTYELFGMDNVHKQSKPWSGIIGWFFDWKNDGYTIIQVYQPGGTYEGHAEKKEYYGYSMDPDDDNYIPGYIHHSYKKTLHMNEGDPSFRNIDDYNMDCDGTKYSYKHQDYPAIDMEAKEYFVGEQVVRTSTTTRKVYISLTNIKITAQHTTGGTKNFTVTVTYSVEGSSTRTRISVPISLAPGQSIIRSLSVPGKGKWANILSIDIREKKKPAIPQPPRITPPIDPPPSPPGRPIIRPRSEESSN